MTMKLLPDKYGGLKGSATVLANKRWAGVAPVVNLRNPLVSKPGEDVTKSPKIEVLVAPQKSCFWAFFANDE